MRESEGKILENCEKKRKRKKREEGRRGEKMEGKVGKPRRPPAHLKLAKHEVSCEDLSTCKWFS